jgi:hypothetical protein
MQRFVTGEIFRDGHHIAGKELDESGKQETKDTRIK